MAADPTFQRALASFQAGNLADAERLFKKFIKTQPKNPAGLNLMAIVLTQLGRLQEAEQYIHRALAENKNSDLTLYNYGIILTALKKPAEALEKFNRALAINPSVAETWNSRGTVLNQLGRHDEAIADFDKAIALNPKYADAYSGKGSALVGLQTWDQALSAYDAGLALNPALSAAWLGRAKILFFIQKKNADAAAAYDRALALKPDLVEAWIGRGNIFFDIKCYDEAAAAYDKAVALAPRLADAWVGRGNVLYELQRYDEAAAAYDRALELQPNLVSAWLGRANVHSDQRHDNEALAAYDKAISLNPSLANPWVGRGGIFSRLNRDDDALQCYEKAISLDPEFAEPYHNMALIKLALGNFEKGWPLYEWRWKTRIRVLSNRNFKQNLWLGHEKLSGKTILVNSEQGFGDTIYFCRYLQKLERLDCKIIFEVQPALLQLFNAQNYSFRLVARGDPIPDFDVYCPLMSLPLAFKTTLETIPAPIPYLVAPREKTEFWQAKLGKKTKPRIGLCWSGSALSVNDIRRNIPLELLLPILTENAEWHSLQKDVRDRDIPSLRSNPGIRNHADALKDFTDTAALISELDLVISVDAVAGHLAGALGKLFWSLQAFHPDFRWMRNREDSPWYPTARLFRQQRDGDWGNVVDRLKQELDVFLTSI